MGTLMAKGPMLVGCLRMVGNCIRCARPVWMGLDVVH